MNTTTKGTYKKFTLEDDNIIIEFIKKSPTNITHALQQAANTLDVPFKCTQYRYYSNIKNNNTILMWLYRYVL